MSGALAARSADHEAEKGRVERTKVHRYWAGKAPEWAQAQEEEPAPLERVRTEVAVPVIVKRADDPRLRRLAGVSREDKEQAIAERRQIRAAEIVRRNREQSEEPSSAPDDENDEDQQRDGPVRRPGRRHESSEEPASEEPDEGPRRRGSAVAERDQQGGVDDEEDEEALLRRRQAVKERLLQQQREEERRRQAQAQQEEEEEEDEEEGSSEYETDTDDDDMPGGRMLKPVFVPKSARDTVAEREALEAEEEAERERERKRMEERKHVTKAILKESIAQEAAQAAAAALGPALGADDIDTDTDDEEALEAYESWKRRELLRIKRDRDAREAREAERLERERLKSMTEEERAAWEKANPKEVKVKQKSKWKFMQKYWHKGAFFQETADDRFGTAGTDGIFQRDYSAPTGEDLFNRELMPKVMQVKNFGRSGRTKYTHLLDQDTTAAVSRDDLYEQVKDVRRKRTDAPVTAEAFAKPKKFKR